MKTFDFISLGGLFLATVAGSTLADELNLSGDPGQRLSGVVKSIDEDGVVELLSPLSKQPIRLKPEALDSVVFGEESDEQNQSEMLVVLSNGDQLPVVIDSFNRKDGLVATAPGLGKLSLPVEHLSSLEFGVESRKLVFEGPGDPAVWEEVASRSALDNVRHEEGEWRVAGILEAQREVKFPTDFILQFRLEWSKGSQPNFKVFFNGPDKSRSDQADRYYLQFASAGFEVKRESTGEQRYASVMTSNRMPGSFSGRNVDVEIHVSRTNRTISLYLDGELEGWGVDPVAVPPDDDFLMVNFSGSSKTYQRLSLLNVRVLDNMRRRHRAEDRGNHETDGLISRDDDRWSGTLNRIRNTKDGVELEFESSLSPEPLALLMDDVSTVFFRRLGQKEKKSPGGFRLMLFGEGDLSVKSCRIEGEKVKALHPLLGEITLPKPAIQRVERIAKEEKEGSE